MRMELPQRFLMQSRRFASISPRLQNRFRILTNESRRLGCSRDVHGKKTAQNGPKSASVRPLFVSATPAPRRPLRDACSATSSRGSPARPLETGDRRLRMELPQRFLMQSRRFASISPRLQNRFRILTDESRRLGCSRDVHGKKSAQNGPKPASVRPVFASATPALTAPALRAARPLRDVEPEFPGPPAQNG